MADSYASHTDVLRRIERETKGSGNMSLCAIARYNLANHLNSTGQRREALRYYHLALRADKNYAQRSYLWRELGVLFFESRRFRSAVACYERAISQGDKECQPFLADSFMWAGEYDRAIAELEGYLKGTEYRVNPEWRLMRSLVRMVRDKVGSGTQHRNRKLALQLASPQRDTFKESQFDDAIQVDGLCGLAWFNQAYLESKSRNYEDAAKSYAAAALCQPNDLQAWCSAVGCAMISRHQDLVGDLISAAYRRCGEQFSSALFEFIKQQPGDFPRQKVIEALGEIVSMIPVIRQSRTVRIFPGPLCLHRH
jgi:tetratricopeptide (TPR) repeat protein